MKVEISRKPHSFSSNLITLMAVLLNALLSAFSPLLRAFRRYLVPFRRYLVLFAVTWCLAAIGGQQRNDCMDDCIDDPNS